MKLRISLVLIALSIQILAVGEAFSGVDPSSTLWTIHKVYLFESPLCTGTPQVVRDNIAAEDFVNNPTLGTANIENGTYNCIAVKMSDTVKFVPSEDSGSECTAGTTYTMRVCDGKSSKDADDGSSISCTAGEDLVWLYISTYSTGVVGASGAEAGQHSNSFIPPTKDGDDVNGIPLTNPVVIDGQTTGKLVIDVSGAVTTDNTGFEGAAECGINSLIFRYQ